MDSKAPPQWPPENGREFVRGEVFGAILVELTRHFADRYPDMDFTDAVAQVFVWFDGKLSKNRRFINSRRFPTLGAFRAYLRQAIWNAARVTMRSRRRRQEVEAPSLDRPIVSTEMGAEERVQLLEMVEGLPEPHKTVFHKFFFDEEELRWIASVLNLTQRQVETLYEEAVDMLASQRPS
jgi:RNA polymerase sigma factor (sigma-70 family)